METSGDSIYEDTKAPRAALGGLDDPERFVDQIPFEHFHSRDDEGFSPVP